MGKPASSRQSTKSNHSLNSSSSHQKIQATMSKQKMAAVKQNTHIKTKRNIHKLFKTLKRQSQANSEESITSKEYDSVSNESKSVKRKLNSTNEKNAKRMKHNKDLIIIEDNDRALDYLPLFSSPQRKEMTIHCSTPNDTRDSVSLQNSIINNFPGTNNNTLESVNKEIVNLTKEINRDSYLTIDLTEDSEASKRNDTVIEIDNTLDVSAAKDHLTVLSDSDDDDSMSGDSDVTVINVKKNKKIQSNKLSKRISKLNPRVRDKLIKMIKANIFGGCNLSNNANESLTSAEVRESESKGTETVEDTFIKEVILGKSQSRNSVGSNIYQPCKDTKNKTGLRMVVIDGSNVAMEHTKGRIFSVEGLKICIDYFVKRGHVVKAFVPRFRCKLGKSSAPRLLDSLERQGLVVYTPSREIQGRTLVPYDDRYIVQCAAEFDGVIVSGDNYRDLAQENPKWRFVIENRVLPFTWVNDLIMFPKDPYGRNGPSLEELLRHPIVVNHPVLL